MARGAIRIAPITTWRPAAVQMFVVFDLVAATILAAWNIIQIPSTSYTIKVNSKIFNLIWTMFTARGPRRSFEAHGRDQPGP